MAEIASYELETDEGHGAYIDIRATDNISGTVFQMRKMDTTASITGAPSIWRSAATTKWSVLLYPNDAMAQLATSMSTDEYEDFTLQPAW